MNNPTVELCSNTDILRLNDNDNVAVIKKHEIYAGHKIALCNIDKGEDVIKYGMPIGVATEDIKKGEHVHVHNVKTKLSDVIDYRYEPTPIVKLPEGRELYFNGFRRKSGDVGIRNELWIVPTVGCVSGIADRIVEIFRKRHETSEFYEGILTFSHQFGCSQLGDDHENTKLSLQRIAKHPNAGGVIVLGLGCENNQVSTFKQTLGQYDEDRIKFVIAQDVEDEVETCLNMLEDLYEQLKNDRRTRCSIADLKIGLECGGSDGFSGITANPLVGKISDIINASGGSTILTEVPEMFGAETILMNRCIDSAVFDKTVKMINGFKHYYLSNNQVIYENPSPGNKDGGITTLEEKALGCTEKAGISQVVDVLDFGEEVKETGLSLLASPGNDVVATTALGISGCHMVLFTTGRGTPFGGFIPTLKIATNSNLASKKRNWIDFNAGVLLEADDFDAASESLLNMIIDVASGARLKHEIMAFREIGLFKQGIIL